MLLAMPSKGAKKAQKLQAKKGGKAAAKPVSFKQQLHFNFPKLHKKFTWYATRHDTSQICKWWIVLMFLAYKEMKLVRR